MIRPAGFILLLTFCAGAATSAVGQMFVNTGGQVYGAPVTSMRDLPFRTVVRQQYDYSCGSAALATLLRYHFGRAVNEAEVFQAMYRVGDQAKIRQVGFSLLDMKQYLQSVGLSANGFRETVPELLASGQPAIAVIQVGAYRHFVVVKGVRPGAVLVGDPALGLKTYSPAEFAKVWNGVVFLVRSPNQRQAFNRPEEWDSFPHANASALSDESLAQFTRGLPPLYQLIPVRSSP